jgi:hypothetical protein
VEGDMLYKGFLITEHAPNCYGASNVHGVTLANFPTLEETVAAIDTYGVAESNLIADESDELSDLSDKDIDLSDIPEITDWSGAVRGKFYRPCYRFCTCGFYHPVDSPLHTDNSIRWDRFTAEELDGINGAGKWRTKS